MVDCFSPEYIAEVNRTARGSTGIGIAATVVRVIETMVANEIIPRPATMLDYGAGPKAIQATHFSHSGYDVTAYDVGSNTRDHLHDPDALSGQYDLVYASKVLNVQLYPECVDAVAAQIAGCVAPGGSAVVNYPHPQKSGLSDDGVAAILRGHFGRVDEICGENPRVWLCRDPGSARRSCRCPSVRRRPRAPTRRCR